jgi:hypothetical protein
MSRQKSPTPSDRHCSRWADFEYSFLRPWKCWDCTAISPRELASTQSRRIRLNIPKRGCKTSHTRGSSMHGTVAVVSSLPRVTVLQHQRLNQTIPGSSFTARQRNFNSGLKLLVQPTLNGTSCCLSRESQHASTQLAGNADRSDVQTIARLRCHTGSTGPAPWQLRPRV